MTHFQLPNPAPIPVIMRRKSRIQDNEPDTSHLILPIRRPRRQGKSKNPRTLIHMKRMRRIVDNNNMKLKIKQLIALCKSEGGTLKIKADYELLHKSLEMLIQSAYDVEITQHPIIEKEKK